MKNKWLWIMGIVALVLVIHTFVTDPTPIFKKSKPKATRNWPVYPKRKFYYRGVEISEEVAAQIMMVEEVRKLRKAYEKNTINNTNR